MSASQNVGIVAFAVCAAAGILLSHPLFATFGLLIYVATLVFGGAKDWRVRTSGTTAGAPVGRRDTRVLYMPVWVVSLTLVVVAMVARFLLNAL